MTYQILIIDDAENDLFDIYRYIFKHDSKESAEYVLDSIEALYSSLRELPQRGHIPPELERINVSNYLELHFKPYRVIYEIDGKKVFVHCVFDGKRDLQDIMERRLLR